MANTNKLVLIAVLASTLGLGFVLGRAGEPAALANPPARQYAECAAIVLPSQSNPDFVKKNGAPAADRRAPVPSGWDVIGAAGGPHDRVIVVCN